MSLFGGVITITGVTFLVFCIYTILTVGYALGRITIKGISLGSAGVFVVATLGSITGGMTSTPALGTLIHVAGTEYVAAAYATTYSIALVAMVFAVQFIIILFYNGRQGEGSVIHCSPNLTKSY